MPSSGYGAVELIPCGTDEEMKSASAKAQRLIVRARLAMEAHLFVEWLESFMAAWEQTKDVDEAGCAGLIEWDM